MKEIWLCPLVGKDLKWQAKLYFLEELITGIITHLSMTRIQIFPYLFRHQR